MKKKRHSGILQAFWPMKVESKSAKHVINITSKAMSKKMGKASQLKLRGTGTECETNGGQKDIVVCIFYASVKTKEVKQDWFLPRLAEDIERKAFCDNIIKINVNIMLRFCTNILCIICRWT